MGRLMGQTKRRMSEQCSTLYGFIEMCVLFCSVVLCGGVWCVDEGVRMFIGVLWCHVPPGIECCVMYGVYWWR